MNDRQQEEFMRLLEPMHKKLEKFALAMTRDREQARDLVHDTIVIAYERFHTIRDKNAFTSYLFSIASNLYKRSFRRSKFWGFFDSEAAEQIPDPSTLPDTKPDIALLYKALAQLPDKYREALVLFEINGLSINEIHAIQGGSLSSIKVRLMRGRQKLAHLLHADNPTKTFDLPPQQKAEDLSGEQLIKGEHYA
jgi:RNA polymerase sigma-70 factor (ECF subfamily)